MNELHRIERQLRLVHARLRAADVQASAAWIELRTRHGWALLATLGATAGVAAWWQMKRPPARQPAADHGRQRLNQEKARKPEKAPSPLRSFLLGLLPTLLPQLAMRLLPPPLRHWVTHPLVRIAIGAWLGKGGQDKKKGAP